MTKRGSLPGFGLMAILAVMLSVILIAIAPPSASASDSTYDSSGFKGHLRIADFGPMTDEFTGYETRNPDGTYYPGDYFYVTVEGTPDGRHGHGVPTGEWIKCETMSEANEHWYGDIEEHGKKKWKGFDNEEAYKKGYSRLRSREDVTIIKTHPNGFDVMRYHAYVDMKQRTPKTKDFGHFGYEEAQAWVDETRSDYAGRGYDITDYGVNSIIENHYNFGIEYSDKYWMIENLKLEPLVDVGYVGAWPLRPSDYQYNLEDSPKKEIVYQVDMQTYREDPELRKELPKTVYARVTFPAPTEGHNIPDEYADENIVVEKSIQVVDYEPVLRAIPYKVTNWKRDETDSMMQRPDAIATRYDGDGDAREENLTPDGRRAVVSGISAQGVITKPLHASEFIPRFADDGSPYYENEGADPPHAVADDQYWVDGKLYDQYGVSENEARDVPRGSEIRLAKKPDGTYYESGVLVSPVYDAGEPVEWGERSLAFSFNYLYTPPPEYKHVAKKMKDEPPGTSAFIYAGFSNDPSMSDAEWHVVDKLPGDHDKYQTWDRITARYLQYVVILRTTDPTKTPRVGIIEIEGKVGDNFVIFRQCNWGGNSGVESKALEPAGGQYGHFKGVGNDYLTWGTPDFYREGDQILTDRGSPWTGTVKLSPITTDHGSLYGGLRFEWGELKLPGGIPRLLRKSVSRDVPEHSEPLLLAPGVKLPDDKWRKVDNENVFAVDSGCWRYDNSNRYKKWRFMLFERRGLEAARWHTENTVPDLGDWFSDAEVSFDVTLWFGQKVDAPDWDHRESWKRVTTRALSWRPMKTRQPVRVTAWRLTEDAKREIARGNARVVLEENAWRADPNVEFKLTFTSIAEPEEFLDLARESAKMIAPMFENATENEHLSKLVTELGENLPAELGSVVNVPGTPSEVSPKAAVQAERDALFSVAMMDENMMDAILEDVAFEGTGPAGVIEGAGSELGAVEFQGIDRYMLTQLVWSNEYNLTLPARRVTGAENRAENAENAAGIPEGSRRALQIMSKLGFGLGRRTWLTEDNKVRRVEPATLPFTDGPVEFNINLSGEGLAAEVTSDRRDEAVITVYAPPKSGGLRHVCLLDNEGRILLERDYLAESFGWIPEPVLEGLAGNLGWGLKKSVVSLTFHKWENSPGDLTLVMTNEWGASTAQEIHVTRGRLWRVEGGTNWVLVIVLILIGFAWVAFVNWLRDRGGPRGPSGGFPGASAA